LPSVGKSAKTEALHLLDVKLEDIGCAFRPVVRPEDDPADLDEIRNISGTHHIGVCLRVDQPYAYNLSDSRVLLDQLDAVGQSTDRTNVVLDCGFIDAADDTLARLSGPLRHLLGHAWHTVAVAAGSFPPPVFFTRLPSSGVTSIPRLEASP
jgi:hypothetical protein